MNTLNPYMPTYYRPLPFPLIRPKPLRTPKLELKQALVEYTVPEDPEFDLGQMFDSIDMAVAAMACYEQRNNLKFCSFRASHVKMQYEYRCIYGKEVGTGKKVIGTGCKSKIRIYYRERDGGFTIKDW